MREAYIAVVSRGQPMSGSAYTEPYEVGWAGEAIVFARAMEKTAGGELVTCISPDGVHWVDEGSSLQLPSQPGVVTFTKLERFGHFLRFRTTLPENANAKYIITLSLKE